ncbi:hypothetical protein [Melittangium boletus]|uniref:hypothetical protein n=1 Tax=Melittangium boletus TaxID=83453 RepID=UPI003DA4EFA7
MNTTVKVMQTVRGVLTLKDFLDEQEVAQVEDILVQCARDADFQVNEREYGRGKVPDDNECERVVRHDRDGGEVTRAMELGTMKHAEAFACVERRLGPRFPEHLSREPRYGRSPATGGYALGDRKKDSLVPDIVLHFMRDANRIQRLYDFYFPCTRQKKSNPLGEAEQTLRDKLGKYERLPGAHPRALVTPQLGISR